MIFAEVLVVLIGLFLYLKKDGLTTIALSLAVLIALNLGIGKLNWSKDLTKNKIFTLSDQSYKVLDNLKQDVTIYGFYQSGQENYTVKTIFNQYAARSKHIKIVYKDPAKYPKGL